MLTSPALLIAMLVVNNAVFLGTADDVIHQIALTALLAVNNAFFFYM